jgi:hypothetical protein
MAWRKIGMLRSLVRSNRRKHIGDGWRITSMSTPLVATSDWPHLCSADGLLFPPNFKGGRSAWHMSSGWIQAVKIIKTGWRLLKDSSREIQEGREWHVCWTLSLFVSLLNYGMFVGLWYACWTCYVCDEEVNLNSHVIIFVWDVVAKIFFSFVQSYFGTYVYNCKI